jgi:hypothetical protein
MPEVEMGDEKEVNFGYVYVENPYGVIYGTVFNDKDGDMDRDFGELGLSSVDVSLKLDTTLVTSDTTNEYGCYTIRIDAADTYTLVETDPDGWHSTTPNEHSIAADTANDNDSPWDFGDTLGATVSGVVWDDVNRDEIRDTGETGIEGVLVELYLGETLVDDQLTAVDGSYSFLVKASGEYTVKETDLVGWKSSTPGEIPVSIGELTGQALIDKDFGDYEEAEEESTIGGTVWNDLDKDGEFDPGEPGIEGVTVSLSGPESGVDTTDVDGVYGFTVSTAGSYTVTETNLAGWESSTPDEWSGSVALGDDKTIDFGDYEAAPEITVTKMVSLDEIDWFSHVEAPVDDTVHFKFTLENTGDFELTDVSLVDTTFGTIDSGLTLGVGDTPLTYYREEVVADALLYENTATATGYWEDEEVQETADASYEGYHPYIAMLSVPSTGEPVTSPTLTSDKLYRIVATERYWLDHTDIKGDAMYWSTSLTDWWWTSHEPEPDGHSFLQIDGQDINWGPFSNGNTGHTYEIQLQGSDAEMVFQIIDWYDGDYTNNVCHLKVYIYEIV